MKILENEIEVKKFIAGNKEKTVGFVPTMGALHEGHISLLRKAQKECDVSIVSIFVNPMQFNNPEDLEKYPNRLSEDLKILDKNDCDYVFLPSQEMIYPKDFQKIDLDISHLDREMEGKYRQGHFEGVANVIYQFFNLLEPQKAYFGKKDFQQVVLVQYLVDKLNLPVEIIPVDTLREENGLAMSSRNYRLNEEDKQKASVIYKSFELAKSLSSTLSPDEAKDRMRQLFAKSDLELEYLEIVDTNSMKYLSNKWAKSSTACIAAYCNGVRLIDNMEIT